MAVRAAHHHFPPLLLAIASLLCMPALVHAPPSTHNVLPSPADFDHLHPRQTSPTDVCKRWSQQSAIINGTLYLYGGRATTSSQQTSNEWNNDFISISLTKTWQISSPSMTGLPQPSGPPAVANGYLWASYDSLYLYGGEFSDTPPTSPTPFSLWEYNVASGSWQEQTNPLTSAGVNAPDDGVAVYRAAEGAGISVASLGRGWFFGGHEDGYTVQGWSQLIPRIYLTSLLEFTFPGYGNTQVKSLSSGGSAGSGGAWRNITQGAIQNSADFPERADGVLVYIPGFGSQGVLLGLAGGNNNTYTQMNIIDVYDIATSSWYKQATTGSSPSIRVSPCAVAAAAADGSSFNVYMYGGQQLQPAGQQQQYDDMWILTVPSFTWISVDTSNQSVPAGRSGHTCNVWDGQMIVVGGYVGTELSCESGIYVFDLSSLKWSTQFTSLSDAKTNPQSQQQSQLGNSTGLQGSFGYQVPVVVEAIVGGGNSGGATVTVPSASATGGPLATGNAPRFTVAAGDGSSSGGSASNPGTASGSASGSSGNGASGTSNTGSNGAGGQGSGSTNVGAIVAGVIAGILAIVVAYLCFIMWLYRKRLRQYRSNVETYGWEVPKEQAFWGQRRASTKRTAATAGAQRMSAADPLSGHEPTFVGIMLHPRRSLRVTNPD